MAVICDDPSLQPLLPQILIFNKKQLSKTRQQRLQRELPPNVIIIRQQSAWTNSLVHGAIMRLLGEVLGHFPTIQPVLLQDAAPAHLGPVAFKEANGAGIWPVIVPANTTWLLQPLDTHGFRHYKAMLQNLYAGAFVALNRDPRPEDVCPLLARVIRSTLQGTAWSKAFRGNGWLGNQTGVSPFIRDHLCAAAAEPPIGAGRPRREVLTHCFPQRHAFDITAVLAPWCRDAAPPPSSPAADAGGRPGPTTPTRRHRLHRKTTLTESDLAAEAAGAAASRP